jgi:hypothetical protein
MSSDPKYKPLKVYIESDKAESFVDIVEDM